MFVPSWVQDAIFYQIFPDRFANGDPGNDPANVQPWETTPTRRGFQGGDLRGIANKLGYLEELGINAIYLNPIFQSPSTHRYDTYDFMKIDPKLGDLADFQVLIKTAHQMGMRVILDGVFNHCGRGFFAFNDILENGRESPYLNWFHVHKFPLNAYGRGSARNYRAWWGIKSLPKLNTNEPAVRQYLLDVSRYWIDQGADGWRLDVPNEIDDDHFWWEFRQVVRAANPEAYTLGEIWDVQPRWVNDQHFDGLMNYPVRTAILDFLTGRLSSTHFAERVEGLLNVYPRENVYAMYVLLGSHDTERVLTFLKGDTQKLELAYLFQFAYPGAPAVYYGDEIGLQGGKDPLCRRAFPWNPARWDTHLQERVKAIIAARKLSPALRGGDYRRIYVSEHPPVYAFARLLDGEVVIVILNASPAVTSVSVPVDGTGLENGQILRSMLDQGETVVEENRVQVTLKPYAGMYLRRQAFAG